MQASLLGYSYAIIKPQSQALPTRAHKTLKSGKSLVSIITWWRTFVDTAIPPLGKLKWRQGNCTLKCMVHRVRQSARDGSLQAVYTVHWPTYAVLSSAVAISSSHFISARFACHHSSLPKGGVLASTNIRPPSCDNIYQAFQCFVCECKEKLRMNM